MYFNEFSCIGWFLLYLLNVWPLDPVMRWLIICLFKDVLNGYLLIYYGFYDILDDCSVNEQYLMKRLWFLGECVDEWAMGKSSIYAGWNGFKYPLFDIKITIIIYNLVDKIIIL